MSYGGYVPCNCYRDGKTTAPPHPEYVVIEDGSIRFDPPAEFFKSEEGEAPGFAMDRAFEQWKENACEHEDMDYVHEWISNIWGMAGFRQLVEILGAAKRFPVLSEFLPTSNDGVLPAEHAGAAVAELESLLADPKPLPQWHLRRLPTGETVYSTFQDEDAWFAGFGVVYSFFFGKSGFVIAKDQKNSPNENKYQVLFQSQRFTQRHLDGDRYLFTDHQTQNSFECGSCIHDERPDEICEYEVVLQDIPVMEEYGYIIESLLKLARASLATGNPIHWT